MKNKPFSRVWIRFLFVFKLGFMMLWLASTLFCSWGWPGSSCFCLPSLISVHMHSACECLASCCLMIAHEVISCISHVAWFHPRPWMCSHRHSSDTAAGRLKIKGCVNSRACQGIRHYASYKYQIWGLKEMDWYFLLFPEPECGRNLYFSWPEWGLCGFGNCWIVNHLRWWNKEQGDGVQETCPQLL